MTDTTAPTNLPKTSGKWIATVKGKGTPGAVITGWMEVFCSGLINGQVVWCSVPGTSRYVSA